MSNRRALIVSPQYDEKQFPYLLGGDSINKNLLPCLKVSGNYDIEHINESITRVFFREKIKSFFEVDEGSELLFYFYGHGFIQNDFGVLVTSDYVKNDYGVLMDEIARKASNSKAREIVIILDCCHSGTMLKEQFDDIKMKITNNYGRVFLAACHHNQSASEIQHIEYGQLGKLSIAVTDVLRGRVPKSIGLDGEIRGSNLGNYITSQISEWGQSAVFNASETGDRLCIITKGFQNKLEQKENATEKQNECLMIGVPFKPSTIFEGRDAELRSLIGTVLVGSSVAVCATIEGLGGIGKTELILQFIHNENIQKYFNTIIWIDASGAIETQWENIAIQLNLNLSSNKIDSIIIQIATRLKEKGKTIIIIDNANEWFEIKHLFPSNIPLLVTTRTLDFGGNAFKHQELSFLTVEAARNILIKTDSRLKYDNDLEDLIERLDGHALAIEIAARSIKTLGITSKDYLNRLASGKQDPLKAVQGTNMQKTVEQCLTISWDKLTFAAKNLWCYASMFAPVSAGRKLLENIYRGYPEVDYQLDDIIRFESENLYEEFKNQKSYTRDFDEAYSDLCNYGILSRVNEDNTADQWWNMHRLVRDFATIKISRFHRLWYFLNLSEWLRLKNFVSEDELPHIVYAILDSTQHLGTLQTSLGTRAIDSEISHRSYSKRGMQLDPLRFLRYIEHELKSPKVLPIIVNGLENINSDVQLQAINLLQHVTIDKELINPLIGCLSSDSETVKRASKENLLAILKKNEYKDYINDNLVKLVRQVNLNIIDFIADTEKKTLWSEIIINELIKIADSKHNPESKIHALVALVRLKITDYKKPMFELIDNANINNNQIIIQVLELISKEDNSKTINNIIAKISESTNQEVLKNIVSAISRIDENEYTNILLKILSVQEDYNSAETVNLLGKIKTQEISDEFIKIIQKESISSIKATEASKVLGKWKEEKLIPILIKKIENVSDYEGEYIIEALKDFNKPEIFKVFVDLVQKMSLRNYACQAAIKSLGEYNVQEAVPILLEKLKNNNDDYNVEVIVKSLSNFDSKEVRDAFVTIINNAANHKNALNSYATRATIKALVNLSISSVLPSLLEIYAKQENHDKEETLKAINNIPLTSNNDLTPKILEINKFEITNSIKSIFKTFTTEHEIIEALIKETKKDIDYTEKIKALAILIFIQQKKMVASSKYLDRFRQSLVNILSNQDNATQIKKTAALLFVWVFHKCGSNCEVGGELSTILSKDYSKREELLELIRFLHPIPDTAFNKKTILRYVDSCLSLESLETVTNFYSNNNNIQLTADKYFMQIITMLSKYKLWFENDFLVKLINDDSSTTKLLATVSVGALKIPEGFQPVLGLLKDENPDLRKAALHSLRLFANSKAKKSVENLLSVESDSAVKDEAQNTLNFFKNFK